MATKVANPSQNIFALLADEGDVDIRAPVKKEKKEKAAKGAAAPAAAAVPTPAEKAKAREAAKAKEAAAPAPRAPKPVGDRPPRSADSSSRGGPRPLRGGRGARRAINAEQHGHIAPAHGRPFDRQSTGKYSRNPPQKKGGAGKGNWGDAVADSVVTQETAALVDGWGGQKVAVEEKPSEEKKTEEATKEATKEEEEEVVEEEDKTTTLDDYLKARAAAEAALAAKIGAPQPRQLEKVDMTGAVEKEKAADAVKAAAAAVPTARKGEKAVNVADVLQVRVPPIGGDRGDRPRGRGRGRGEGGRGRGEGRGGSRGGRGGSRGGAESAPRGAGAPRGGGAPRARPIDVSSSRQFPSLGKQ